MWKAAAWFPVMVFAIDHGFSFGPVEGRSMQPTFNPDASQMKRDIVFLNKWAAADHEFERGEVVTLMHVSFVAEVESPTDPKCMITKRVIALQGDTVKPLRSDKTVKVPEGHCWIEGDEGFHSIDSNTFGTVPVALIKAKVTRILWPPERFGPVAKKPLSDRVKIGFIQPGVNDVWG
ncbi:LexA/Signal peptidase [Hesseltinella vesiculosa]|uniref:Mitochondrial inner membrane protease subunit 2 n=1 Tax=Hesseltinella vesiculosa TaxID=101127 RepID=A0A1X2G8E9_9FUNG|nr:LexA/Signal peptidase [Hesseltinella vesiculosa]